MARTKGSSQKAPAEVPDDMSFTTREAECRFQSLKADKTLAPERGASVIHKIYDLDPTDDEYIELVQQVDNPEVLTRVAACLCVPNTEWKVTKEGSYNLKCSRFRPEVHVWFHFLCNRLMPTLHTQTISRERAFLLYRLLEGKQIDVDALIYKELFAALQSTTGNLWLPALITELYRSTKVIFDAIE
ncbi:hypothetical protein K1719_038463 [Acacia pycnantha]|nr:hypothetical protein K1719_038463 [Acacia pycnantha]